MSQKKPNPTLLEVAQARRDLEDQLSAHISVALKEFRRSTGLYVDSINVSFVQHRTNGVVDGYLLSDVTAGVFLQ